MASTLFVDAECSEANGIMTSLSRTTQDLIDELVRSTGAANAEDAIRLKARALTDDIGTAELLFPDPWFSSDAGKSKTAAELVQLASTYHASREATLRRFAERSTEALAVVFFVWKLKPTQKGTVGVKDQGNLFGITP